MDSAATLPDPTRSGYVEAGGIRYYHAVYGAGEPLLLLHGGLGTIEMFGPVLEMLAERREVIGVDLHGHGRTPLGDREISPHDMGDDLAALLPKLGYGPVDVMGYSLGAGVALRLALQHPRRCGASCSSPAASRRTASTRRCCRSRRSSPGRWRSS